ncbi:monooxygenase [Mycobacterium tuberculosis variant africanum]|nr:monooxygenase [Mycobacterium tuberculosis variant africanum]
MRLGIYWAQEALAYGMTKRPNTLKIIEAYAKYNIRRSVKDRELRRKLTPRYRIGCKRILNSSTYYPAVADPKTELITDRIDRITHDGIVTADGTGREVFREADVIVYATGFHVTDSYTYVQIKGVTARTWSTAGTVRASVHTAGSPSPTCPTCSSCWGRTLGWDTTPWCS